MKNGVVIGRGQVFAHRYNIDGDGCALDYDGSAFVDFEMIRRPPREVSADSNLAVGDIVFRADGDTSPMALGPVHEMIVKRNHRKDETPYEISINRHVYRIPRSLLIAAALKAAPVLDCEDVKMTRWPAHQSREVSRDLVGSIQAVFEDAKGSFTAPIDLTIERVYPATDELGFLAGSEKQGVHARRRHYVVLSVPKGSNDERLEGLGECRVEIDLDLAGRAVGVMVDPGHTIALIWGDRALKVPALKFLEEIRHYEPGLSRPFEEEVARYAETSCGMMSPALKAHFDRKKAELEKASSMVPSA